MFSCQGKPDFPVWFPVRENPISQGGFLFRENPISQDVFLSGKT
jgi:hypothetical protein